MTTENTLDSRPAPTPAGGVPRASVPEPPRTQATPPTPAPSTPRQRSAASNPAPGKAPVSTHSNNSASAEPLGLVARVHEAFDVLVREMVKFGAVGALGYVVDIYVFNLLRVGVWPIHDAPLGNKIVLCKVISVTVATFVTWLGNRYWTFRHRRRTTVQAEFFLFMVMNIGGLLIAAGCLGVSHYLLGLTSPLADNISANVVGLVLGTLFRFWAYRKFVFTDMRTDLRAG